MSSEEEREVFFLISGSVEVVAAVPASVRFRVGYRGRQGLV